MRKLLVIAFILFSFQFAQDLEAIAGINIDGIIYTEDTTLPVPHDGNPFSSTISITLDGSGSTGDIESCSWATGGGLDRFYSIFFGSGSETI